MSRTEAMKAFAAARQRIRVAWDQEEALGALAELESKVYSAIFPHRKPKPSELSLDPVVVNSTTRWG